MLLNENKLNNYFQKLDELDEGSIENLISKYLDDEDIEVFCNYIEDFYGVEDDEEIGMLAQIMISGFIMAKELDK